jgi:hypothetical protein
MLERRLLTALHLKNLRKQARFLSSTRAFAIPVTYLILFVSLMGIVFLTYTFAMVKINARGNLIKASVAKQNMQIVDDAVHSVAWSFGASEVVYMDDCGGVFKTAVDMKRLVLNLTDEHTISAIVFNSSVGEAFYELEASESNDYGLYIRGDERAIINRTSFTMTQLHITADNDTQNAMLSYRPLATAATIGTSNGKPLNLIRINIINLNSSQNLKVAEKFYLKATSLTVTTVTSHYQFNGPISSLALKAVLDGTSSTVWLPITSTSAGAVVDVEVVICNVKLQKTEE